MMPLRRKALMTLAKSFDLFAIFFATLIALGYSGYQSSDILPIVKRTLSSQYSVHHFCIFIVFLAAWHAIFNFFGLYNSKRLCSPWHEIKDTIKAVSTGSLLIVFAGFFFHIRLITPEFVFGFFMTTSTAIVSGRLIVRKLLDQVRIRGRNMRHMLILGTNKRAIDFARKIDQKKALGYQIIGFADNDWEGMAAIADSAYSLVSSLDNFTDFLIGNVVDEVVICLPVKSHYTEISRIIGVCEEQGVIVRFLSDIFELKFAKSNYEYVEGESVITLSTGNGGGGSFFIKRMMDICISGILLILLFPLFVVVGVVIKATSRGPVLFLQERIGLNKRIFRLFKFRTMVQDAEKMMENLEKLNEVSGPVFKIKNDPRITPIGKFLRKSSIDELPQLINVLMGDMSLVGPRPLPIRDYNGFSEDWHRRRFSVKPGITCLWQVTGRSDVSFEQWMKLDMEYIDKWSLWFDFIILLKTLPAVLKGQGAT